MNSNEFLSDKLNVEKERVVRGRWKIFLALLVASVLFLLLRGFFNTAQKNLEDSNFPPAPTPWQNIVNVQVILPETGQMGYLRFGWIGDIRPYSESVAIDPCPLPQNMSWQSGRQAAMWYDVRLHCDLIRENANAVVDANLIAAVMMNESGGWSANQSSAGAIGLMQIMPVHECATWDPPENVRCGVSILDPLVRQYGLNKALAAYNAGETGMLRGNGFDYAQIVSTIYQKIVSAPIAMK